MIEGKERERLKSLIRQEKITTTKEERLKEFGSAYQQQYCDYEKRECVGHKVSYNITGTVKRYPHHITRKDKILVIPCENGEMVYRLRKNGFKAYGADLSLYAISVARKEVKDFLIHDDLLDTRIRPGFFDVVVCRYLLEHFTLEQIETALINLHKIAKSFVYLGITNIASNRFFLDPTHKAMFNLNDWEKVIKSMNLFEIVKRKPSSEEWLLRVINKPQQETDFQFDAYKPFGKHAIINLSGIRPETLNDENLLADILEESIIKADNRLIKTVKHHFDPEGISVMCLLQESHASIHTYPTQGVAFIDLFTCGDTDIAKAVEYIKSALSPSKENITIVKREIV